MSVDRWPNGRRGLLRCVRSSFRLRGQVADVRALACVVKAGGATASRSTLRRHRHGLCQPRIVTSAVQPERGVFVRHQQHVRQHPVDPPVKAHQQVEQAPWVVTGEEKYQRSNHRKDGNQVPTAPRSRKRALLEPEAPSGLSGSDAYSGRARSTRARTRLRSIKNSSSCSGSVTVAIPSVNGSACRASNEQTTAPKRPGGAAKSVARRSEGCHHCLS